MMKRVLVISPHADDETLGCAGTLLGLKNKGYDINWLIVTSMKEDRGYTKDKIDRRCKEIARVAEMYKFSEVIKFQIATTEVDKISKNQLVGMFSNTFKNLKPNIIFAPNYSDIHTDHREISTAILSCSKWFRHPYIEKILFYETLSETNFNINYNEGIFKPNVYVNITGYLRKKIEIMEIFESEIKKFPFPRSKKAIESLAYLRGSECGKEAAEAFQLLRANIDL